MKKIIINIKNAPGDCLVLTTVLKAIQEQYPNKFLIDVFSYYPEVFFNSKYLTRFEDEEKKKCKIINLTFFPEKIKREGKHYVNGYIDCINKELDINIKLNENKPNLFLTDFEINKGRQIINNNGIKFSFWIFSPGFKIDMPLKAYPAKKYQEIIKILRNEFCIVQTGSNKQVNPKLKNVISLVGKTECLRDYFSVCYHSSGMIGHTSLQMHVAAALNKKCIILGGGRELPSYAKYDNQIYLNTIGKLDCCVLDGCWKKQINECVNFNGGTTKCMDLLLPEHVVEYIK